MSDVMLNLQKLKCPMPIVHISKELKKINSGQTLEVKADDPAFGEDVKAFCRVSGNNLESFIDKDGIFTVVIQKA